MIRETMLDPAKLRGCVTSGAGLDDRSTARDLVRAIDALLGGETFYGAAPEGKAGKEKPRGGPLFCHAVAFA